MTTPLPWTPRHRPTPVEPTTARPLDHRLDRRGFLARVAGVSVAGTAARAGLLVTAAGTPLATASPAWATGAARPGVGASADRHGSDVLDAWLRTLYSGFMDEPWMTPGRAARLYATAAVAAYEAVQPGTPTLVPLAGQLAGLTPSPVTTRAAAVDWPTAASSAIAAAVTSLLPETSTGLRDAIERRRQALLDERASAGVPHEVADRSELQGGAVGLHVAAWMHGDGAQATFTRPYTPPAGDALWRSTPPNFGTAIDPYWGSVRPMALPSADACAPPPHIAFSTAAGSAFHDQALAVLAASDSLDDAGRLTALFWRDNPTTSGLPSGHWMRLVAQVAVDRGMSLAAGAEALAVAGIALHDAFISCWHAKYSMNLLRPISYIRLHVEGRAGWSSFVNTPQFPEYTSGHSVASQAAATVLTGLLGTLMFTDRTHALRNPQLGSRTYTSFQQAAEEAAGSRLLGGIHYPMGITVGMAQGEQVGRTVLERVRTRATGRR